MRAREELSERDVWEKGAEATCCVRITQKVLEGARGMVLLVERFIQRCEEIWQASSARWSRSRATRGRCVHKVHVAETYDALCGRCCS